MTEETNIITDPIFTWTIREDGIITIYIMDVSGTETRLLLPDVNAVLALSNVTESAQDALAIFREDGYDAAVDAINSYLEENDMAVTEDDFTRLLNDD